jgi:hypothetical protein
LKGITMRRLFVFITLLAVFALSLPVQAARGLQRQEIDQRFALVIGNNDYRSLSKLEKAVNDARAMGKSLTKIGYQTSVLVDADRRQMNTAINRFVENIAGGGEGILFFAGHGVQINNQNYLLPVDIENPRSEVDVADQGVNLQHLQDKIAQVRAQFTLLVIDACRDNPLPKKAGRSLGASRGMAQASSAEGQMVIFSAGANQQALDKLDSDDRDPNGVFTRELLPWLIKPGVSVRQAMLEVRRAVFAKAKSVNHDQFPAVYDQVLGDYYFVPAAEEAVQVVVMPSPKPIKVPTLAAPIIKTETAKPVAIASGRPTLMIAALGLPTSRSFWSRATSAAYTQQMQSALQFAGRDVMKMDAQGLELGREEFDSLWNESRQAPQSRALCAASSAPQALLVARVETPTAVNSDVPSAHWPELSLRLIICKNQFVIRQSKALVPENKDVWPFSTEFEKEVERFLRSSLSDLSN